MLLSQVRNTSSAQRKGETSPPGQGPLLQALVLAQLHYLTNCSHHLGATIKTRDTNEWK